MSVTKMPARPAPTFIWHGPQMRQPGEMNQTDLKRLVDGLCVVADSLGTIGLDEVERDFLAHTASEQGMFDDLPEVGFTVPVNYAEHWVRVTLTPHGHHPAAHRLMAAAVAFTRKNPRPDRK